MTYEIPFIHSVEANTRSLIDQTLKTCATCRDGDIVCSSNGPTPWMNKCGWQPSTGHYFKGKEVKTMTYQTPTVEYANMTRSLVQQSSKNGGECKDSGGSNSSSSAYEVDE